jgi:hypothetical protein
MMNFGNTIPQMQNDLFFEQFREITWGKNRSTPTKPKIDKILGGKVTFMREM